MTVDASAVRCTPGKIKVLGRQLIIPLPNKKLAVGAAIAQDVECAYRSYQLAKTTDLSQPIGTLWVENEFFRGNIKSCLNSLGVEETGELTMEQIKELLFDDGEGGGLLWGLNFVRPKLLSRIGTPWPLRVTSSLSLNLWRLGYWVTLNFTKQRLSERS